MASASGVLYIGVSNDLVRRAEEHRQDLIEGFTKNTNVTNWFIMNISLILMTPLDAKKELKGWKRFRKLIF